MRAPLNSKTLAALLVPLLLSACTRSRTRPTDAATPRAPAQAKLAVAATQPASAPRSPGPGVTWMALLEEAPRAELESSGLLIDLGTPDQDKYNRGGWLTGWGPGRATPGVTSAAVRDEVARLHLLLRAGSTPRTLVARVRSDVADQRVGLTLGAADLGEVAVPKTWTVVSRPIPPGAATPGWHQARLRFTAQHAGTARGEVDWVWLREGERREAPSRVRVGPLRVGSRVRRALLAPEPRRYLFYLEVPPGARLTFEYGAAQATRFVVRAGDDAGGERELWRGQAAAGEWRRAQVDLGALVGRAVRLELATEGPAGPAGWGEPEVRVPPPTPRLRHGPAPRNVIVVLLDAARADVFRALNPATKVRTPTFDRLAAEGTAFASAYVSGTWTKPSVATLLTGLYAFTHGVKRKEDVASPSLDLLSERLRAHGFATAAFVANPFFRAQFGFDQGWDLFRNYTEKLSEKDRWDVKLDPAPLLRDALAWVTGQKQRRFFAYVHLMATHVPYRKLEGCTTLYHPQPYAGPIGQQLTAAKVMQINSRGTRPVAPADAAWIRALYHGEVTCQDRALGVFVEGLRAAGLLDDTLLIVTADHGDELLEHGLLGHGSSVYDSLLRVPLVVRHPGRFPEGARVTEVVESVDLMPMVLELVGAPPVRTDGLSLLRRLEGTGPQPSTAVAGHGAGYQSRAIRVGRFKLAVVDEHPLPRPPRLVATAPWPPPVMPPGLRLFDVEADPGETRDLHDERPVARRLCEVYLGDALASPSKQQRRARALSPRRFTPGATTIDPQLRKQLEALGYLGD